jgi:GT2 family glycosyltransferase
VGVVVLAYGDEEHLEECLTSIGRTTGVEIDLVVVDNGCTNSRFDELTSAVGARVLRPRHNRGFAGGCNEGAAVLDTDLIALINSDVVLAERALRSLADAVEEDVAIASASVRLADRPHELNSAGNPVHYTGLTWAGAFGERASDHARPRDVASASGATMMIRREVWELLGGFDDEYFTYLEDTELSLRCWLLGMRIVYVPDAVSLHHYEFSRNADKMYYLERNRLLMVLTVYERRTLLLLAPALLFWEICALAAAMAGGWWRGKIAGWIWIARHLQHVRARRALVHAARAVPDADLVPRLEGRIRAGNFDPPPGFALADAALAAYWGVVRRLLGAAR